LFSARRKTLRKSITQAGYDAKAVLEATAIDGQQRSEELTPQDIWRLFNALPTANEQQ
jgi:16S rRNA A1518/A1519 N6-dimethyltransferase RsmA/KsgA/DIM1 with predicted DNA glycosylase/AP lyase activity